MRLPVPQAFLVLWLPLLLGAWSTELNAADHLEVCEVLQHPQSFNGKMISFRTRIQIAFEDFEVDAPSCASKVADEIWLEYGKGPKRQPTTWCCGDVTPRDQLGLIQDSAFQKFDSFLRAIQKGQPLDSVTATLS